MTIANINRRAAIGAALGAVVSVTAMKGAVAKAAPVDFSDPAVQLASIMKMRGATDERLCIGYVTGMRYAVVDGVATPMFGILAATFGRGRKVADYAYESRSFEIAYFTDLTTGKLLETWTNPITNKIVRVPQTRSRMGKVMIKGTGLLPIDSPMIATMEFGHQFRPAVVVRDEVSITEEIRIRNKAASSGPRFRYNENTTYTAAREDLANPNLATVPTAISYQSLVGFSPWLGMEGIDGLNMGRGTGHRVASAKELPPYFLELTERYHADVLADPVGAIDGKFEKKPPP
jgi:hypothetical protein